MDQRGSDTDGAAAPSGAAGLESMLSVNRPADAPPAGDATVTDPHVSHRGPGLPAWPVWLRVVPLAAGAALAVAVLTWAGGDGRTGAASTPEAVVAGEPDESPAPVTVTAPAGAPRGYTGIPVTVIGPTVAESAPGPGESHETTPPGQSSDIGTAGAPGAPPSATAPSGATGPGGAPATPPAQSAPPDRRPGQPGGSAPESPDGRGSPAPSPDDPSRDPASGPVPSDPDGTDPTVPPEPARPPDRPEPQGPPDLPPGLVDNPADPQPQGISRAF